MKLFQDRIWLVLLGVAVAILVTLTTVFWNEPTALQGGADPSNSRTSTGKTWMPRITGKIIQAFPSPTQLKK